MVMAKKKARRFGNPAKQAVVDAAARERALVVQAVAVAAAKERNDSDCRDTCCA